jgi:hypothetical protein
LAPNRTKSRVFAPKRVTGGHLRKKFHSYEIILPVDKKIIPWERFSINSDSRDKKNVAENL